MFRSRHLRKHASLEQHWSTLELNQKRLIAIGWLRPALLGGAPGKEVPANLGLDAYIVVHLLGAVGGSQFQAASESTGCLDTLGGSRQNASFPNSNFSSMMSKDIRSHFQHYNIAHINAIAPCMCCVVALSTRAECYPQGVRCKCKP